MASASAAAAAAPSTRIQGTATSGPPEGGRMLGQAPDQNSMATAIAPRGPPAQAAAMPGSRKAAA